MKTSRVLSVIFPVTAALALAQTAITPPITSITPTIPTTTIGPPTSLIIPTTTTPVVTVTTPVIPAEQSTVAGETTITLDVGFGIRAVGPSRVTVPVAEKLRIVAPKMSEGTTYTWTKNGSAITSGPDNFLMINHVVSSDAGTYVCKFSTSTTSSQSSQTLVLGVGPTDRLLNLSTRGLVGTGADQGLTTGFVVAAGSQAKKLIVRAVGPSLAMFGVTNPLAQPVLRIYDANGRLYENGYVYPAVVGGPTYETDLAESLARTGAFPIPNGTADKIEMKPFVAGSYTATVTSGNGTSGAVLLEIYEVP